MLLQIVAHTPTWVFAVFALLIWLGSKQWIGGSVGLVRATVVPLAMAVFSLYGVVSAFAATPSALIGWAAAAAVGLLLVLQRRLPDSTRYDAARRSFHVAGSAVPLVLMMGIFSTKYVVGVQLVMHPELATHLNFALAIATLYGAFAGVFTGRAVRLCRLALRAPARIDGQAA
ncbi:DUF6622 family protein [Variovorax ginsengisoli]|uniref:Transmembrane protein n=1 Tax=Variovorax ginsengisoli TaxID=363844 RepID=A0ABT9S4C3_9BURK|nr:DUF6622 family protein [Variovorax ginsengisoli]MDP9899203.1 hypothetical protein [Variovorax ginsengisoli]